MNYLVVVGDREVLGWREATLTEVYGLAPANFQYMIKKDAYSPRKGQAVAVYEDGLRIFQGVIRSIRGRKGTHHTLDVECQSYLCLAGDGAKREWAFPNQTAAYIYTYYAQLFNYGSAHITATQSTYKGIWDSNNTPLAIMGEVAETEQFVGWLDADNQLRFAPHVKFGVPAGEIVLSPDNTDAIESYEATEVPTMPAEYSMTVKTATNPHFRPGRWVKAYDPDVTQSGWYWIHQVERTLATGKMRLTLHSWEATLNAV